MDRFEGPEKKLEIILSAPQTGLRDNTDGRWDRVVRACCAEILRRKSGEILDSYLLSESSLFVWNNRLLIITCGKTTPVNALPIILEFIDKDDIAFLFYERKKLNFPEEQPTAFEEDLIRLQRHFPGKNLTLGPCSGDHIHVFYYANSDVTPPPEVSLQVLMHNIDPEVGKHFFYENINSAAQQKILLRLYHIHPDMAIDSHFFYPQGYSLNGTADSTYCTVHVTPQPEASYASFESNGFDKDVTRVVGEIISIFNPQRYSVVLTTSNHGRFDDLHRALISDPPGYCGMDQSRHKFDLNYVTTFSNFLKQRH